MTQQVSLSTAAAPAKREETNTTSGVENPAFLSEVGKAFHQQMHCVLSEREIDGVKYPDAFHGLLATTTLARIIGTEDRGVAALLGRALEAQGLFRDVKGKHRLRDHPNEVYQFVEEKEGEVMGTHGVFTLLTSCYSPTCSVRNRTCYSSSCPYERARSEKQNYDEVNWNLPMDTSDWEWEDAVS